MRFLWVCLLFLPSLAEAQCSDISISERVDSLITISRTYTGKRKYDSALATSAQAEELARTQCGEESAAYGSACFNQGRVRYFMGNNQEAVPWYEKSKDIRGQVLGTDHEDYGKSLNNLAISYGELSRYEAAEPLYRKALTIREAIHGRESVAYSSVLSNLSSLYRRMGHYEAAEALGVEAMEIRGKVLGRKHRMYSASLNNLASLYVQLNQDEKALAYYQQSLGILQAAGDTVGRNYAIALRNLGAVHFRLENYGRAETFFNEGRQHVLSSLGEGHYLEIAFLHNLGLLYEKMGDREKGMDYLLSAIDARKARGDTLSSAYTQYLLNYGKTLFLAEDYAQAKWAGNKALAVAKTVLAKENRSYSGALLQVARSFRQEGAFEEAKPLLVELGELERERMAQATRHLTEAELEQLIASFIQSMEWQSGFAEQVPDLAASAYDNALFYKGFLLQASRGVEGLMATDQEQYDQLKAIYRQLAKWYVRSNPNEEAITKLETSAAALEKKLIQHTAGLGTALRQVSWEAVRAELAQHEVAIEYIDYVAPDGLAEAGRNYAALVLTKESKAPAFIPLGSEATLLKLLEFTGESRPDYVNDLYTQTGKGEELSRFLWKPIATYLEGLGEVTAAYVAPTGLLHQLNLSALPTEVETTIGDEYQLKMLGSTRQLLKLEKEDDRENETLAKAFLMGGIDYGGTDLAMANDPKLRFQQNNEPVWHYLPWTEIEVVSVGDILQGAGYEVRVATGVEAREDSLKSVQNPRLLHLATHGFYYPAPDDDSNAASNLSFQKSKNPLIRSGLILANANASWSRTNMSAASEEDGILTAYEVEQLALRGTELVVLSACDTGLGQLRNHEGVYGLQRAFRAAGAQQLIYTLWQIPDFQTQEFMLTFYQSWLEEGQSITKAFQLARQELRKKYPDPFFWAGFVLVK